MKAIQFHEYGGPEVLALEEIATPQPGAGQVLVRVVAAGVNPADWKIRSGAYQAFMPLPLPSIPGMEGAGVVESVGADVTDFQPGQEVYGILLGGYAEYALAEASRIRLKPDHLSFEEAASVPVGALTAWSAVEAANIQPGQQVLVHGAAGGVGLYAVQLAHLKDAHVTATGSAKNAEYIRSLGAETIAVIERALRAGVAYARSHPSEAAGYIREHAQEMSDEVCAAHIGLYVNDFSTELGAEGERAIAELLRRAEKSGIIPPSMQTLFA